MNFRSENKEGTIGSVLINGLPKGWAAKFEELTQNHFKRKDGKYKYADSFMFAIECALLEIRRKKNNERIREL